MGAGRPCRAQHCTAARCSGALGADILKARKAFKSELQKATTGPLVVDLPPLQQTLPWLTFGTKCSFHSEPISESDSVPLEGRTKFFFFKTRENEKDKGNIMFNYHTRWRGRDKQKKINKTLWNKRGKKK